MDIGQTLTFTASKHPARTAILFEEKRITYRELNERVNRVANALLGLGLKKRDRVAALFFNSPQLVEVYLGAAKAGGVFTPINFRFTAEEVRYILEHSDAKFLFFGAEFSALVQAIRPGLARVKHYFSAGDVGSEGDSYEALLGRSDPSAPDVRLHEQDECQLMYTSGTTGKPKGAIITQGNVLWNLFNTVVGREDREGEVSLVIGPLYHTAALNNHFTVRIALAGTSILIRNFDPRRVMEIIEKERVNVISGAPAMYHLLLALPDLERYDTSSVTKCTTGASSLPEETKLRLAKLFPRAGGVCDVYGCTEASPSIAILQAGDSVRKQACVGPPVSFVTVKIVDEQGREVPCGSAGELICRGPNVMKGYYKNDMATAEALRGGWLHTGDIARMDDEGFVYIVDRKKDMLVSGGENIYPREIEEILYRHPLIADVAVVGVPDAIWGEAVRAVIVLKQGATMTEGEVIEYCKNHLASYKKPRIVEFVRDLPRNPSGKVLKATLRENYSRRKGEET